MNRPIRGMRPTPTTRLVAKWPAVFAAATRTVALLPAVGWSSELTDEGRLGHFHWSETLAVASFVALVALVLGTSAGLLLDLPGLGRLPLPARRLVHLLAAAGCLCLLYGVLVEPYRLVVRELRVESPKVRRELRIVHLSDLHVRRWSGIEGELLRRVERLRPDLILLTGDYTAVPGSREDARRLLESLAALAPTCAVRGNIEAVSPLDGPPGRVRWLVDRAESLTVDGQELTIVGADAGREDALRGLAHGADARSLVVALYHYPDLVPELAGLSVDLLLSGHTHGGQVRLPWLGALVSASRAGTRYAWGLFRVGDKAAYVSAGVGCESFGLPRLRFLCPPEVALIVVAPRPRPPAAAG